MIVSLQWIIQKWQFSKQGDGGIDTNNDEDEVFGLLNNRLRGGLNTRAAFLGTNPSYLLYIWEMLHKYQVLSTAFNELNKKMCAKNGRKGFPLVINNSGLFESDVDVINGTFLDTGSTLASSGKEQSSSSYKSATSTKTKQSGKLNNSDFS
jgi:hypothetical protein